MQTQAPSTGRLIALLAFAVTSVVLAILVYVTFAGTPPFTPKPYQFSLRLPDAGNLVQGSDVDISGVKIGDVRQVTRVGGMSKVTLDVDPAYAPIRSGASAIYRTKTLLGEAYIELAPGPSTAAAIPDGGELAPPHVRAAVSLDQFLQGFNPTAVRNFRELFGGFAQALHGQAGSLNGSLGRAAPFSADLAGVTQTLGAESGQLQTLFASSGEMMRALGARVGDLQAAVRAGDAVFTVTGQRNHDLQAILRALPPFLSQLHATSNVITSESPEFDHAMVALVPAAQLFAPTVEAFKSDFPTIRRLFDELPAAIRAGERGFPALRAILLSIPDGFNQLYPAARELIPVIQLMAAYSEEAMVGPLANAASAINGAEVGPGGRIIVRPGASVYLSNESIGGYVKRLPTNRANPYPKPTWTSELGKLGFLPSYDCRNIHNPEYLPPLGTGVPPCLTQGPWTYRGKTAYYPRLSEAGP
jgi:virulence factor Mce-like protein